MPRKRPAPDPAGYNLELEVAALRAVLGALPVRTAAVLLPAAPTPSTPVEEGTGDHAEAVDEP